MYRHMCIWVFGSDYVWGAHVRVCGCESVFVCESICVCGYVVWESVCESVSVYR